MPLRAPLIVACMATLNGLIMPLAHAETQSGQQAQQRVAVLDLVVEGDADPALGSQLGARLTQLLGQRPELEVLAQDEIRALLKNEQNQQLLGCSDDGCLAELAGALGADLVLSGKIGRLPEGYALSFVLIDAQRAKSVARVSQTWTGESISLLELAEPIVELLLWRAPQAPSGALVLDGAQAGSRIFVDDQVRGTAPAGQMAGIPIGAHILRVEYDDWQSFVRPIIIHRDRSSQVQVRQLPIAVPLYARWWVWGGVGAGLASLAIVTGLTYWALSSPVGETGVDVSINAEDAMTGGR